MVMVYLREISKHVGMIRFEMYIDGMKSGQIVVPDYKLEDFLKETKLEVAE